MGRPYPVRKPPGRGRTHRPPAQHRSHDDVLWNVPMWRYIEAHCEWLLVMQYSADTVASRKRSLRTFVAWAHERGIEDPREVTKPIIDRYQRHLYYYRKEDGTVLVPGTQVNLLRAVKTFFKWATRENHILYNPASELDVPRVPRHLPRHVLTVEEVAMIINATDTDNVYGLRDRTMLEILYSTGMRRKEIASLTRSDLDFTRQVVFIREGKGAKDRVVPMGDRAAAWLEKYLFEARPQLTTIDADALFVTDYGDPASGYYIAMRVKRYMEKAGIERPGAAHLFRHACATHMLEGGADIRYIQTLLGHDSLDSTQVYTHVSIEKLKAIHAATHPARLARRQGDGGNADDSTPQPDPENAAEELLAALDAEDDE